MKKIKSSYAILAFQIIMCVLSTALTIMLIAFSTNKSEATIFGVIFGVISFMLIVVINEQIKIINNEKNIAHSY